MKYEMKITSQIVFQRPIGKTKFQFQTDQSCKVGNPRAMLKVMISEDE